MYYKCLKSVTSFINKFQIVIVDNRWMIIIIIILIIAHPIVFYSLHNTLSIFFTLHSAGDGGWHTTGHGWSSPGGPCSPFSPFRPLFPSKPLSPWKEKKKEKSTIEWYTLLSHHTWCHDGQKCAMWVFLFLTFSPRSPLSPLSPRRPGKPCVARQKVSKRNITLYNISYIMLYDYVQSLLTSNPGSPCFPC